MKKKADRMSIKKVRILSACVATLLVAVGVLAATIERNALSAGFGEEDGDALELTACPEVVCVGKTSELTVTINRVCGSGTVITIKPSGTVVGDSITIPAGSLLASKTTRPLNTPGTLTVTAEFINVAVPRTLTDTAEIDVVSVDMEGHDALRAVEEQPVGETSEENPGILIQPNNDGGNPDPHEAKLRVKAAGVAGLTGEIDYGPNFAKLSVGGVVLTQRFYPVDINENADTELGEVVPVGEWALAETLKATLTVKDVSGNTIGSDAVKFVATKVDIREVISDQLSARECNKLPVKTPNANDPMLMGARSETDAYLAIRAAIHPSSALSSVKIGVQRNKAPFTIISSVAALQSPQRTLLNFTALDGISQYEVVGGIDVDNDGLESSEVCVVFTQRIRVVTFNDYDSVINTLNGPSSIFAVGIAQDLLDHYLTGGAPSPDIPGATRTFYLQRSTEPDHPLGQDWNFSCQAPCGFYTFADGSAVSDAVEESFQMQERIRQALVAHASEVQTYFATPGSPDSHEFPVWSWSGSIAGNDWRDPLHFHPGLFGAFGGVNIYGKVHVTVQKSDFKVTHIHYTGEFDDLYDFNITRPFNAEGATIQAGYPTLGVAGRIFKTHVECDVDTKSFSYTFPASPKGASL